MLCPRCTAAADQPDAPTLAATPTAGAVDACTACGAPLLPPPPGEQPWIGRELRGFRVEKKLGAGGMGMVFLAEQLRFRRKVAIKVLPLAASRRPELVERFEREARALAALDHPHVVPVHDIFEADGFCCLVMGYAPGGSLRDLVKQDGPLPEARAAELIRQAALGLAAAAERGIIHRDIKPHNLLLDAQGAVRVADFGLARGMEDDGQLTTEGAALGTPAYMAPEQWDDSRRCDTRSDLYALGCTLYELLAGMPPFLGPSTSNFVKQHLCEPPPDLRGARPRLSQAMHDVLDRLLAKKPADRFQSAAQLADVLRPLAAPSGSLTRATLPEPLLAPRQGRHWRFGAAAVLVVCAGLTVMTAMQGRGDPAPGATADTLWWRPTAAQLDAARSSGESLRVTVAGLRLVLIPPGTFLRGSPEHERGRVINEPQQEVTLARPFYLGATEVTQGAFEAVMGYNPARFKGDPERPVENLGWIEAVRFCNALSARAGLAPAYAIAGDTISFLGLDSPGYRLPTEAEWEYACRAGSTTPVYTGAVTLLGAHHARELDAIAWYGGNSGVDEQLAEGEEAVDASGWAEKQEKFAWARTHPVGRKLPNSWGLYDTLGNVFEMCNDFFANDAYGAQPVHDPLGPASGDKVVLRGGSFASGVRELRAARRHSTAVQGGGWGIGLRIARSLP